jgi:hypothetical protein
MFDVDQRTAVAGVFFLAGYEGELRILPPATRSFSFWDRRTCSP